MSGTNTRHAAATTRSQDPPPPPLCSSAAVAATAARNFSDLWQNVSKLTSGKTPESRKTQTTTTAGNASPRFNDLQSPLRRPRLTGGTRSDSPGDVEPSQDIIWDSTSPANSRLRSVKVEISDLVNRIAPKDVKPHKSSLLQWIGDSAVPCTPDIPKQKVKKRSSRPNNVEDLMRLARQFDENMQQDNDMNERLNIINNNNCLPSGDLNQDQPALSCDSTEAELRALFDGSTQKVSGPLSQSSTASACSQEATQPPVMPTSHKATGAEDGMSSSQKASQSKKCDDFDDDWDWENDELLGDSMLMAINPAVNVSTKTTMKSNTKCVPDVKPSKTSKHAPKVSNVHTKLSYGSLQALCPKPKTTTRSTFKLGPDLIIHSPLPNKPCDYRFTGVKSFDKAKPATDDFSDDADDALLYQLCDTMEKISDSQPDNVNQPNCQKKINISFNRSNKVTTPVAIAITNTSVKKQSTFVRSQSLPATSSTSPNCQAWDKSMKSSTVNPQISQSLPVNHAPIGLFSHTNLNPNTVKSVQKSSHNFKRNMSDSAVICNKVFVTSEKKCSAAEIEKKKQEALARRRQRTQNSQKT